MVIDGEHGVINTGDLPLYQLPGLWLSLLGDHRPSILGLTWPDLAADLGTVRLRPLPGLPVLRLEALRILSRDLFAGEQHALLDLADPPGPQAVEAFDGEHPDTAPSAG